jgi:FMN reductase
MTGTPLVRPLVLGIGGTPREGSSTERAVRIALAAAEAAGAEAMLISGPELLLPMYVPGQAERSCEARRLVEAFRRCDGLILGSPAYHGSISGMMKNALDYVEDLREGPRVYFDGVAVGLIVCAGGWQAAGQTLSTLRGIVHALRGWPTPLGATLNTSAPVFDEAGACLELSAKMQLETVGRQVVEFARMRKHADASGLPG